MAYNFIKIESWLVKVERLEGKGVFILIKVRGRFDLICSRAEILKKSTPHLSCQVIFAICPPCSWFGGWLTFVVALCMIGIITAIVGDLATIFGCLVGLEQEVTAFTFVALGTSLPDLFASKTAARNEKYADASVGNVTGSNSVNVFLGLGTPWVIATIYHTVRVRAVYLCYLIYHMEEKNSKKIILESIRKNYPILCPKKVTRYGFIDRLNKTYHNILTSAKPLVSI